MGKKFISISLGLIAAVSVVPTPVLAEAEHEHASLSALGWPACNFVLFVGLLVYLYRRNISQLLSARSKEIAQHIQAATQKFESARQVLADVSDRLESVDVEKRAILSSFENDGQKMAEEIVRNAERAAQGVRQDMVRRIESEFRQATNDVRSEMVKLAAKRARERLQSELSSEQDGRLRREAVDSLEVP